MEADAQSKLVNESTIGIDIDMIARSALRLMYSVACRQACPAPLQTHWETTLLALLSGTVLLE